MKIAPKTLSRIIANREAVKAQNHLLNLYNALTPKQRSEIRNMFKKNNDKR